MLRRTLETMGPQESGSRERGAWTPFVGGALAALTAGSLIVFSLVAQKTSLEGFSSRGVTAIAPSVSAPRSITLPGGATDVAADSGGLTPSTAPQDAGATALSTLTPGPVTSTTTGLAPAADSAPGADTTNGPTGGTKVAAAPNREGGDRAEFDGRLDGGGARPDLFRLGPDAQAPNDAVDDGDRKAKKAKSKKADKSKKNKGKKGKKRSQRGRSDHGSSRPHHNKARGHSRSAASRSQGRSTSGNAAAPSRPRHSSPPAPRPRPQPQPQPQQASKPKPAPPGHAKSNGPSKNRGGGRGKG